MSPHVTKNADNISLFNFRNFGIFKNNILTFIRPKPGFLTAAILRGLD